MLKRLIFIGLLLLLAGFLYYHYAPRVVKTVHPETVDSRKAKLEKKVFTQLQSDLQNIGLTDFPEQLLFTAFKEEQILEIYAKAGEEYRLLKSYPFTANSGKLGPKLREGDRQIPEGIYNIEYLNPNSSYYLSLKVSYPNAFDRKQAKKNRRTQLGGDIFIHGKSVTIGCIPVGDQAIEEVFILAANAFENEISVIIAPRDFRKNSTFPEITDVNWEDELYQQILTRLSTLK